MSGHGIFVGLLTTLRGRKLLSGSFTTAGTGAVTSPQGDGASARASAGSFDIVLPKAFGTCESLTAGIEQKDNTPVMASPTYDGPTGTVTIDTYVSGATGPGDTTGCRVNWHGVFSDRVP